MAVHTAVQTDPMAKWVIVLDNLNVHCSVTLVGVNGINSLQNLSFSHDRRFV